MFHYVSMQCTVNFSSFFTDCNNGTSNEFITDVPVDFLKLGVNSSGFAELQKVLVVKRDVLVGSSLDIVTC